MIYNTTFPIGGTRDLGMGDIQILVRRVLWQIILPYLRLSQYFWNL